MTSLILPTPDGGTREYRLNSATSWSKPGRAADIPARLRRRPRHPGGHRGQHPRAPARLDWDATLAYRHELWSYGLGVADAMDTAQRGMGLDWAATQQLIKRTGSKRPRLSPPAAPPLPGNPSATWSPAAPAPTSWT